VATNAFITAPDAPALKKDTKKAPKPPISWVALPPTNPDANRDLMTIARTFYPATSRL
jgi:hypothetical protein